jgi:hypothetical protein
VRFLKRELETTFADYENNIAIFEDVLSTYTQQDLNKEENVRLENRMIEYKNKQELLSFLQIQENIIEDLEWAKENITRNREIYDVPIEKADGYSILSKIYSRTKLYKDTFEKERYKTILTKIHHLISVYYSINRENIGEYCNDSYSRNKLNSFEENKIESSILITKPNFTLDNFFLHPHAITSWQIQVEFANNFIDKWMEMAYSIYNWRDEIQFDLSTFPSEFEKKTQYALHLFSIRNGYDANNVITL